MKSKTVLLLLVVFVCLSVIAYAFHARSTRRLSNKMISGIKAAAIKKICISRQDKKYEFEKNGSAWQISSPISYPADTERMDTLVKELFMLSRDNMISDNKARHPQFGVDDSSGIFVNLYADKPVLSVIIGKASAMSGYAVYARISGEDRVYVTEGPREYMLLNDIKGWRDMSIISFDTATVSELDLCHPKELVRLVKKEKKWFIGPAEAGIEAEGAECENLLNTLLKMKAYDILEKGELPEKTAGFSKSAFRIVLKMSGGLEYGITVGNAIKEENVYFRYYIRRDDKDVVFVAGKYDVERFMMKHAGDFVKKQPLTPPSTSQAPNN